MDKYKNYFRQHYKADFSRKDIKKEQKWFFSQWDFILSKISIRQEDKILEIGSGLGGIYKFLENKNNYTGIEVDPEAVRFTNNFFKTNCFQNTSLEVYRAKSKFDLIFAIEVLEHFENLLENIKKINKLLAKGGTFIGTSPYPFAKNIYADETHNYVLHPENWKVLFKKAGFAKVSTFPMSFLPFL